MKVLVVEPQKPCRVQEIESLPDMQQLVGGDIEAVYPFQEPVALVCNSEGKLLGLPMNRPLLDKDYLPYWTSTTVQRKMQSSSASGQGCFRLSTHLQPAGVAGSALTPKEKNCAISMTTTQTCGNGCWSCRPCPTR